MKYAAKTNVAPEQSRAEIERILMHYGALGRFVDPKKIADAELAKMEDVSR